jgi:hypothetical protein
MSILAAAITTFTVTTCVSSTLAAEPEVLFDGKSLDNFKVITCEAEVKDGAILLVGGNGLVQTKKRYSDYTFSCEWKTLEKQQWDSGIYFRYDEIPEGRPWPRRYQVNLLKGQEGNLVGFPDAVNKVPIKPQEWNSFELTVKGAAASLKVNGKLAWKADGLEHPSGYIAIQAEVPKGGRFMFRNVRVIDLSKDR